MPAPCGGCSEPLGGRYGAERLCWECYVKAHPKAGREPRRQDERTRFHRLVDRTWEGLANRGVTVHYLSRTHISCRCPICVRGIVSIHFIESDPPQIDIDHDGCTAGCTAREIMELVG